MTELLSTVIAVLGRQRELLENQDVLKKGQIAIQANQAAILETVQRIERRLHAEHGFTEALG
jgi:hypothetical protein